MKKIYLLALVLLCLQNIRSQVVFCPPGAKWNYTWSQAFVPYPPGINNTQITYTGDTLIGSETLKKISHEYFSFECLPFTSHCDPTYLKQKGDTVFMWNNCTQNSWQILYNFAATPGQSWTNSFNVATINTVITQYTVAVQLVNTVTLNFTPLKELTVQYVFKYGNNTWTYQGKITERLGSNLYLFHFWDRRFTDCPKIMENLCYSDQLFGTLQYGTHSCTYSNPVGLAEYSSTHELILFPNPAKELLEINLSDEALIEQILLYDSQGKLAELKPEEGNKINIQILPPGLYFLEVITKAGSHPFRQKFIKE